MGQSPRQVTTILTQGAIDIQQELLKFKGLRMDFRITHKLLKITVSDVLTNEFELTQFLDIATVCVRKVSEV